MAQSDQETERNYRKNLMIAAATISIYSIAGGGFESELAIAGAKLKFTSPQYLESASIVVLLFLWWRHWLVSLADRASFKFALACNVAVPKEIDKKASETLQAKAIESRIVGDGGFLQPNYILSSLLIDSIGLVKVSYKVGYTHGGVGGKDPEIIPVLLMSEPIVFIKVNYNYRKEWLRLVLFDTRFGDAILPSVMTCIAIISYSYNYFTR